MSKSQKKTTAKQSKEDKQQDIDNQESSNENDRLEKDYAVGELVDRHCQQLGLLVRPFINLCIISPPLVIVEAQVDELVSILKKGLELTLADLREQGIWQDDSRSQDTALNS